MKSLMAMILGLVLGYGCPQASAGSFDVGVGLGFADSNDSDGFGGGWDFQAGYEDRFSSNWNIGGQVHHIQGWTSRDKAASDPAGSSMYFQSTALYATARPQNEWLQWLQLKGGVVHADYQTLTMNNDGLGMALGAGVVLGGENFRFHLLDIEHYRVAGRSFTSYSISVALWAHGTYK
jgi:hypothetical protein